MELTRRTLLASAGLLAAGTAGCLGGASGSDDQPTAHVVNPPDVAISNASNDTYTVDLTLPDFDGEREVRAWATVTFRASNPDASEGYATVTITNADDGETLYADAGTQTYAPGDSRSYEAVDPSASGGDTIEITLDTGDETAYDWRISYGATVSPQ